MADDDAQTTFMAITDSSAQKAASYLQFADGNLESAVELYYANNGADLTTGGATSSSRNVIDVDDDGPDVDEDSAMAQRIQNELYGNGGGSDEVRAPMARTAETLVGPGADPLDEEEVRAQILARLAGRSSRRAQRSSPFNQRNAASAMWADDGENDTAEESSTRSRLAQLYSPPRDLFASGSWDYIRDKGKKEEKWIIVDVQNPRVFDCQKLNRDIWKDPQIQETLKAHFITLQFDKDNDPRGTQYIQYYFPDKDIESSYPHISIIDPRTGEKVKNWSGPPAPTAPEFLNELHTFLDRYSLSRGAKNPVAKRKAEAKKDVSRMTEEEQMQWAIQQSANGGVDFTKDDDPDALTKSISNLDDSRANGRKKDVIDLDSETESETDATAAPPLSQQSTASPFASIPSDQIHTEPAPSSDVYRIQFKYSGGRRIRRFDKADKVQRIFEWLKSEPIEEKDGVEFELKCKGRDLVEELGQTLEEAGLKNETVMVEFNQ